MIVMNVHARYSICQIDNQRYATNLSRRHIVITDARGLKEDTEIRKRSHGHTNERRTQEKRFFSPFELNAYNTLYLVYTIPCMANYYQ